MKSVLLGLLLAGVVGVGVAEAHVVVTPNRANVATSQVFSVSVPNEKDVPVTELRLVLPSGLAEVSPTVKAGWTIDVKKDGDTVTEIDWSGGNIPAEQRDDFTFGAQVPGSASTLTWKAYQTYQDGSVVSWDKDPATISGDDAVGDSGPYSVTSVIDDLTGTSSSQTSPLWLGVVSVVLAAIAVLLGIRPRKHL